MKKWSWLLAGLVFIAGTIRLIKTDFPITLNEAKENYTAFTLLKTGGLPLSFPTDNDFISPLAVYLRVPVVAAFGLTYFSNHLPAIIFGALSLILIYLVTKNLFASAIFAVLPFVIQTNIFSLELSAALCFYLLAWYARVSKKTKTFYISLILGALSSATFVPIALVLLYLKHVNKISWLIILLFGLLVFNLTPGYRNYFIRTTMVKNMLPKNFAYIIERRISVGFTEGSPLKINTSNLSRLAFNKPYFILNGLFTALVKPFDYETLTSVTEAGYILDKTPRTTIQLPKFFFWEIPFLIIALLSLIKSDRNLKLLVVGALVSSFLFGVSGLIFLTPLIAMAYAQGLKKISGIKTAVVVAFILFMNYVVLFDLLWNHPPKWIDENSLRQQQIWNTISPSDTQNNMVTVTDRLGSPAYYYLYYHKVDPAEFLRNHEIGKAISDDTTPFIRIGNVKFYSFKLYESDRKPNQIWVGLPGEMVGSNRKYSEDDTVSDGVIYKRIVDIKQNDPFVGSELWFVKTKFDKI